MKFLRLIPFLTTAAAAAPIIAHHPQRDMIDHSLQRRVNENAPAYENHFYLVRLPGGADWVYWPEGKRLWKTTFKPVYEKKGPTEIRAHAAWDLRLYCPRLSIDLDHDLVSNASELGEMDWRVTKDYVEHLIHECTARGELITLFREKVRFSLDPRP